MLPALSHIIRTQQTKHANPATQLVFPAVMRQPTVHIAALGNLFSLKKNKIIILNHYSNFWLYTAFSCSASCPSVGWYHFKSIKILNIHF